MDNSHSAGDTNNDGLPLYSYCTTYCALQNSSFGKFRTSPYLNGV